MAKVAQAVKQFEGKVLKVQTARILAPRGLGVPGPTQTAYDLFPTPGNAVTVSSSTTPLQNLRLRGRRPRGPPASSQRCPTKREENGNKRGRETLKLWTKLDVFAYEWHYRKGFVNMRGPQQKGIHGLLWNNRSSWKKGEEGDWALRYCENHEMEHEVAQKEQLEWLRRVNERCAWKGRTGRCRPRI